MRVNKQEICGEEITCACKTLVVSSILLYTAGIYLIYSERSRDAWTDCAAEPVEARGMTSARAYQLAASSLMPSAAASQIVLWLSPGETTLVGFTFLPMFMTVSWRIGMRTVSFSGTITLRGFL